MEEDFQEYFKKYLKDFNSKGISDFEGYSRDDMRFILYDTFGENSPIRIRKLSDSDYKRIPLLNQIKYLMELFSDYGEIKLTKKGFLPTKVVADIYSQGFLKEYFIESGISKLYKETDSMTVHLSRIIAELSGTIKKRKGILSLTKTGEKILLTNDNDKLLRLIIEKFGSIFNWAYLDGFEENGIGSLGFGFTLILLSKYGHEKQLGSFYAEKYFKAFPSFLAEIEESASDCYCLRTFERFLDYFGLINIERDNKGFPPKIVVSKTEMFDKLIECTPHNMGSTIIADDPNIT